VLHVLLHQLATTLATRLCMSNKLPDHEKHSARGLPGASCATAAVAQSDAAPFFFGAESMSMLHSLSVSCLTTLAPSHKKSGKNPSPQPPLTS